MKTIKTACLFAPALALAWGAASAASNDESDALRERSSPAGAASPVHVQPAPANAISPEWERRMAATPRQEESSGSAGAGSPSREAGTTEGMARPRAAPSYDMERPAPWSNSPY